MQNRWLLTLQFFESPEHALERAVPDGTQCNGPHEISDRTAESLAKLHRPIAEFVEVAARLGERAVSIAGDCCASIPVLAGLQRAGLKTTVVWIDAHGDFNTPETSPSQFLGGMPLAMIVGRGPQWMCDSVGMKPQPEHRVWLIDGRDLDPLERSALDASAVRRTGMSGLATLKIAGPVWVHLDVDVLDSDEAPASNYPVKGGPGVEESVGACNAFARNNDIVALSVSGWAGSLDTDGSTAKACNELIGSLLI